MSRVRTVIPVAVMFIILAALFVFMCLPLGTKEIRAENGVLDLGKLDENICALEGQWEFYYGQLLTPQEISNYEGEREMVLVPSSWEEQGYPQGGVATYRLLINTSTESRLMLYLPEVIGEYCIWVNGEVVYNIGNVYEPEKKRIYMDNMLIPVTTEESIEIVIQVSNYVSFLSGLKSSLIIGESSHLLRWFVRTRGLYCMALGFVLMAAFYHMALYIFRQREKIYLFFSMLCILCFFRFLYEINGLFDFFGLYNSRVQLAFLFAHSASILIFTLYIFNHKFLVKYKYAVAAYAIFGSIFFFSFSTSSKAFLVVNSLAIMPFMFFVIIVAAKSNVLKTDKWTRLYFIALLCYFFVGTLTKMFTKSTFFMPGLINNIFMIMAQSLILSKDYTKAFALVEETNENLERIVDERTQDLQKTNQVMKELIGNISHDLKTPLSVLSVNLEQLGQMTQTLGDIEYQKHVNIAYHKNLDLQRLLQNLFEVSRIETGRSMYTLKWISLNELMAGVQQKYGDFVESQSVEFIISSGKNVELSVDKQKVWSVFDNIIYNAVRHTKAGGCITVTSKCSDNRVVISVRDTGCGIFKEHLVHIFERFYKASSGRDASNGDSGLGLYIVKSIMEGLGGTVSAESEVDVGTTFHLTFLCRELEK